MSSQVGRDDAVPREPFFRELAETTSETADAVQRDGGGSRPVSPFVQLQQHQMLSSNAGRTARQSPATATLSRITSG